MGRLGAAIVIAIIVGGAWTARADPPVKIAGVPDGPIKLGVAGDARELRRTLRLVPSGVDSARIDQVRLVECTDGHGQACAARVEPGGCAGGCQVTTMEPGSVTVVVATAEPGTYTSSLEIVYISGEQPGADGKPEPVKALVATALEVTRTAVDAQPMGLSASGPNAAADDRLPPRDAAARLRVHLRDDDGAPRKDVEVIVEPVVRKIGTDSFATAATVRAFAGTGDGRVELRDGKRIDLPAGGVDVEIVVDGLETSGSYEGKLRLLAPGRTPAEITYGVRVRDGILWAALMIALGAGFSFGVQKWVASGRQRLVQQRRLERLRDRLRAIEARPTLLDRDRRLLDQLFRELGDRLEAVEDGDTIADDELTRFGRRIDLAGTIADRGQDVEGLPAAARAEPRRQLDGHAITVADRSVADDKLKEIETALAGIAGVRERRNALTELLTALDNAVAQARGALSTALQSRLTAEVEPPLADAHAASDDDRLDDLQHALTAARRVLARVQGAALLERVPEAAPAWFDGGDAYRALRTDVVAKVATLERTDDADADARLYDETARRLALALGDACIRATRAAADSLGGDLAVRLRQAADDVDAARARSPGEAFAAIDRANRLREAAIAGPTTQPISAPRRGGPPAQLASIPWLAPLTGARHDVRVTSALIRFGDSIALVVVTLLAVVSGLVLLWTGSATWGGWGDWLTALLWGAGLHTVGSDRFKGLLKLQQDVGKPE